MQKPTPYVLIVDDEETVGKLLKRFLSAAGYECTVVQSAQAALVETNERDYSVVVSDINMPEMNGIELLMRLRETSHRELAIIMLTARHDLNVAVECLKLGAYDYLTKPISYEELTISVSRAIERRTLILHEKHYQEQLEIEVANKTLDLRNTIEALKATQAVLERTQKEIIYRLAIAAEHRDEDTGEHLYRIAGSSYLIAREMGLDELFCKMVHVTSPLHDVGKIGIPDNVLLKPGKLDEREWELMKTHPLIGAEILRKSETNLIQIACDIAEHHHEHFNGKGYPHGKRGEDIPLAARIVAVADVFDALTSKRPYKEAWDFESAKKAILQGQGSQFDPAVVDAFLRCADNIFSLRQSKINLLTDGVVLPDTPPVTRPDYSLGVNMKGHGKS